MTSWKMPEIHVKSPRPPREPSLFFGTLMKTRQTKKKKQRPFVILFGVHNTGDTYSLILSAHVCSLAEGYGSDLNWEVFGTEWPARESEYFRLFSYF